MVVTLDGERLLADPGFGMSVLRPIPLVDGAEDDYGGWRYRLREVPLGAGRGWTLQRWRRAEHWELMHTHDELPVQPLDVTVGHHYTSTFPTIHFRNMLMVTKHLDGRHVAVTHETVTVRRPGEPTQHRALRDGELSDLLDELGVPLDRRRARSPAGQGQPAASDSMTSATGQAPPIVLPMTVAVVPRAGWWADQNDTPASPPDMVISGESDFTQKPRP